MTRKTAPIFVLIEIRSEKNKNWIYTFQPPLVSTGVKITFPPISLGDVFTEFTLSIAAGVDMTRYGNEIFQKRGISILM